MELIIKIIRILEVIGFLFANIVIAILFSHYVQSASVTAFVILYGFAFFCSLVILKSQWFFFKIKTQKRISFKNSLMNFLRNLIIKKIPKVKWIIVLIKQLFYNVLFELFPIFLLWICVFGLTFFLLGSSFFTISNLESFFGVITIFGILLGVFQYYMTRHEEKIVFQISQYAKQILSIINNETNFSNFYEKIGETSTGYDVHYEIRKWIERKINQKYKLVDLLKEINENDDIRHFFFDLIKNSKYDSVITIKEDPFTSDKQFEMIEVYAKGETMHDKLFQVYEWYFNNPERIEEIYNKIKAQIDFEEFSKLVLGNINIIQESLPQFIDIKFKTFFEQSLLEQDYKKMSAPKNAQEYRSILIFKLYSRILKNVLS
jgi:hypothetical protein